MSGSPWPPSDELGFVGLAEGEQAGGKAQGRCSEVRGEKGGTDTSLMHSWHHGQRKQVCSISRKPAYKSFCWSFHCWRLLMKSYYGPFFPQASSLSSVRNLVPDQQNCPPQACLPGLGPSPVLLPGLFASPAPTPVTVRKCLSLGTLLSPLSWIPGTPAPFIPKKRERESGCWPPSYHLGLLKKLSGKWDIWKVWGVTWVAKESLFALLKGGWPSGLEKTLILHFHWYRTEITYH